MNICVDFYWRDIGEIKVEAGHLRFPNAPQSPGVYRFRMSGSGIETMYIGESDRLQRRFQHYRTPGTSQRTNRRLNALLADLLAKGGRGKAAVITEAMVNVGDGRVEADLVDHAVRLLVENAALVAARKAGIVVENL